MSSIGHTRLTILPLALCLVRSVSSLAAPAPDSGGTVTVPRPASPLDVVLQRFNRSILFHAGWDHGRPTADMAVGPAAPARVEGTAAYAPGFPGQALADGTVTYAGGANLRLDLPGSAAFWMSVSRTDPSAAGEGYLFPLRIHAGDAEVPRALLMVGKINRINGCHLYVHAEASGQKQAQIHAASTLGWREGEWHLLVLTWRRGAIEFSVDAAPPITRKAPRLPGTVTSFSLSARNDPETGLRCMIDSLIVLDRPLSADEILWVYESSGAGRGR